MSGGPHGLFTIAPGRAFLGDLAAGLVHRFGAPGDPLALAGVTVFLPTRRAARTLAEKLTEASGLDAIVLPRIVTLGDVDEDEGLIDPQADLGALPPEVPRLQRELILAERVAAFRKDAGSAGGFAVSLALARALARLIDEAANEDADLSAIAGLAPADLAQHWEKTVAFLGLVTAEQEQADLLDSIAKPDSGHSIAVAESGGVIVGFVSWKVGIAPGIGEITLNGVHPDHGGKGIGTALSEHALAALRLAGMKLATVGTGGDPSHAPARRAYEKAGFSVHIPSIYMYRKL